MGKRVLIHSLVFPPDGDSTAYLYGDIALALQAQGFDVTVLTTTPHYNLVKSQLARQPMKWKIPGLLKESRLNGMRVLHVPQKKYKSTCLRLIGFMFWHIVSFFVALGLGKVDVILSPSPPLTLGLLNLWIARLKKARVVYNVQEVYPDILALRPGMVLNLLRRMEKRVYRKSDAITTIDRIFSDTIAPRIADTGKLHVIPNFVNTEIYRPVESLADLDPAQFEANDHLKVMYAGNIGFAQDWLTLLELARLAKGEPIDFYVLGEGKLCDTLRATIKAEGLTNLRLLDYQPRLMMPQIIAFSDVQFIFMNPATAAQGFPSKVYTIMACAKALLVSSSEGSPIVNLLKELDCARIVTQGSSTERAAEMLRWLSAVDRDELKRMGLNGLREVEKHYTKENVLSRYARLIDSL